MQTNAHLTFYIFASRTDLWYSEVRLKAISRARKSALEMKIGQIVHHTLLFLKRLRHFEFLVYVFCYSASKSGWDAKNWISSLRDIERFLRAYGGHIAMNSRACAVALSAISGHGLVYGQCV